MKQTFTAFLHCNMRDTLISPKALLTNIIYTNTEEQFRDHTWVHISKSVARVQPKDGNNKPLLIQFKAKVIEYISVGGKEDKVVTKYRLCGICGITII